MDTERTIAKRLKRIRGSRTQKEFAKDIGLSYWAYCKYETGKTIPPSEVLSKIADSFNVTVDWLVTGQDVKKDMRLEQSERREILSKFGNRCIKCHFTVGDYDFLDIVALEPSLVISGEDLKNMLVLCPTCRKMFDKGMIATQHMKTLRDIALAQNKIN